MERLADGGIQEVSNRLTDWRLIYGIQYIDQRTLQYTCL